MDIKFLTSNFNTTFAFIKEKIVAATPLQKAVSAVALCVFAALLVVKVKKSFTAKPTETPKPFDIEAQYEKIEELLAEKKYEEVLTACDLSLSQPNIDDSYRTLTLSQKGNALIKLNRVDEAEKIANLPNFHVIYANTLKESCKAARQSKKV